MKPDFSIFILRASCFLSCRSEFNCTFENCDDGQCCCSIQMMIIYGEKHNITIRKGGESVGSKIINITAGSKFISFKNRESINLQLLETDWSTLRKPERKLRNILLYCSYVSFSTVKPSIPTNITVKESNGNFQVKWIANKKESYDEDMSACVTYRKKGDTEEVRIEFVWRCVHRHRHLIMWGHFKWQTAFDIYMIHYNSYDSCVSVPGRSP